MNRLNRPRRKGSAQYVGCHALYGVEVLRGRGQDVTSQCLRCIVSPAASSKVAKASATLASSWRISAANWRISSRCPPFQALRATFAFPSSDLGPVDFSHGRQLCISSDCLRQRSGVHPFLCIRFQYFVWLVKSCRVRGAWLPVVDLLGAVGDVGLPDVWDRVLHHCQRFCGRSGLALRLQGQAR